MTDDETPTPMPAASVVESVSAGTAAAPPIGVITTSATPIASARPSTPTIAACFATRSASTM